MLMIGVLSIPVGANPPQAEFLISDGRSIDCGGGNQIELNREGWADQHPDGLSFHITMTYTNSVGDTWVYQDTGSVRYWTSKSGDDYAAVAGHTNDVGGDAGDPGTGDGNYGRWVINQSTGEFYAVGSYRGVLDDAACDALTS
jgi:hypothetical protein